MIKRARTSEQFWPQNGRKKPIKQAQKPANEHKHQKVIMSYRMKISSAKSRHRVSGQSKKL